MGCDESKEAGAQSEMKNVSMIHGAFLSGVEDKGNYCLAPVNQLEYVWKKSLPESSYGAWSERVLNLDDHLKMDGNDAWATTMMTQLKMWCRFQPGALEREKGIGGKLVLGKYALEDAKK